MFYGEEGGRMKKPLYGGSFVIFWIILNLATGWAQQATGPRMVLEEKYFDAKQVKEGEIIEHTFKVLNVGDRSLEIKKVKPG
ncbi:MAG: DUF1573 domain-containing protein [Desulfobacteraceae bacterium]|nr:MAG: DUF1573 domain-containing protein [Desulfobacteraceae bacterium]